MKRATSRRSRGRRARRVPARAVRGLGGRAAGRRLPAGHVHVHGTAHDLIVPAGRLLRGDRRDDHARPDPAGRRRRGVSSGRASANDVTFGDFAGAGISQSTVGHDIVAGGTDSGAGIIGSTIGHDFVGRGEESGADILRSTIGHDMRLLGLGGGTHIESVDDRPRLLRLEAADGADRTQARPNTPGGPVKVGHDFTIEGSPDLPFVFDGLCDLHVGRDLRITDRTVNLGIGLGDHCAGERRSSRTRSAATWS